MLHGDLPELAEQEMMRHLRNHLLRLILQFAEYDAAKEAQQHLEMKIVELQQLIMSARIIDESKIDTSKALLLSTVKIKNLKTNAIMAYTLVPEKEADLKNHKISVTSPIAKGLLGKSVGDQVEIQVPAGKVMFEIIEITR